VAKNVRITQCIIVDINFSKVRTLSGSQRDGFEEVTSRLFFSEEECEGEFTRVEGRGGDGGVEAYWTGEDGKVIGFQSKFFEKVQATQWRQIDKSISAALKNHKGLGKYVIAVPRDLTPEQKTTWDKRREIWNKEATEQGWLNPIEFVWWGASYLRELLTEPSHRSKAWYWFGIPDFSLDWLAKKNRSAVLQLGKRYSPKQHLETNAGRMVDAFAWGDLARASIVAKFVQTQKAWRSLRDLTSRYDYNNDEVEGLVTSLVDCGLEIEKFRWPKKGYPDLASFYRLIKSANEIGGPLYFRLDALNDKLKESAKNSGKMAEKIQRIGFGSLLRNLRDFTDAINYLDASVYAARFANCDRLIIKGEAGSGKSHLIADAVEEAEARKQPALLILGERFTGPNEPWTQFCQQIGWSHGVEALLSAMNEEAKLEGRPALICIDALNETDHRSLWRNHLIEFSAQIESYPSVKLMISCRTDYLDIVVPEALQPKSEEGWPWINHRGFGNEVVEAVEMYFKAHKIGVTHFPPVLEEFRNPLFLRVFCEAFEGKEFPTGIISLKMVMEQRVHTLCEKLQEEINCDPADTREALSIVSRAMVEAGGDAVPRETVRKRINELHPASNGAVSLFQRILSNGMLVETRKCLGAGEKSAELVRFPFERFSDYFVAEELLSNMESEEDLLMSFRDGGSLVHLKRRYWQQRGLGRALAILIPERFGREAADLLLDGAFIHEVLEDFLFSLPWRSAESFSGSTDDLIQRCRDEEADVLDTLFRVSAIPEHPYNSRYLLNWLLEMDLSSMEVNWTIPVSVGGFGWEEGKVVEEVVSWSFRAPLALIPDDQALLAARVLILLCSSNWQGLRERAAQGAIRILRSRPLVMVQLLTEMEEIRDPYIVERLFASAAGVAMRFPGGDGLRQLATEVNRQIFAKKEVPPNIAVRDFAQSVLESCRYKKCLPEGVEVESFRPPFNSVWPLIQSEEAVKRIADDDEWATIYQSVIPEGMGNYGDFGRYTMGAVVHQFSDKELTGPPPTKSYEEVFPAKVAMRWILQRVEELGWNPTDFRDYERNLPSQGRNRGDVEEQRIERISKKYQKIALRELMGYLSDHYHLALDYGDVPKLFTGAWEIWGRDFDPASVISVSDSDSDSEEDVVDEVEDSSAYTDQLFLDDKLCSDREKWVTTTPPNFAEIIEPEDQISQSEFKWLTLGCHLNFRESEYDAIRLGTQGRLGMWLDVRSFLVAKSDRAAFVKKAKMRNFWGEGCDVPGASDGWLGEYPWGQVFDSLRTRTAAHDSWLKKPIVDHINTCCHIRSESSRVPSPQLLEFLNGMWSGEGEQFVSNTGELLSCHIDGHSSRWGRRCVVRRDVLREVLAENDLEIVWCALSEKSCWSTETSEHIVPKHLQVSAVYWLDLKSDKLKGGFFDEYLHDFSEFQ